MAALFFIPLGMACSGGCGTGTAADSCADCHQGLEHVSPSHGRCSDCHGGDPTTADPNRSMASSAGYIGAPDRKNIPALCGSCHANVDMMRQYDLPTDQWSKYQQSTHGLKLAQGDSNVATCFNCHDGHATKEVTDTASQVYPSNVPALCSSCHSNAALMTPYGIPTDQYTLYTKSVHGVALLEKQDLRAPNCASCHGKTAKWDGPAAASLKQAPADLTTLAKRNGGKYPSDKVTHVLRGQAKLSAHGDQEMPVWGPVFWHMSQGHEEQVHMRIGHLLEDFE